MGDAHKSLYAKLTVDVVIGPVLERLEKKDISAAQTLRSAIGKLEKKDISAAQTLRSAIGKADTTLPGLAYDFLRVLLKKAEISEKVDLCETLLRLGGVTETEELRIPRSEHIYQELNNCASDLKRILSRIPEQIYDRKQFLETIKEIANSIKTLLDAVNHVIAEMPMENGSKQILEDRKKDFVRYSKKFSNTLKDYFRDTNQNQNVFISADYLIYQTNVIMKTVRQECY